MMKLTNSQKGFTLIELLVATAVGGMVLGTLVISIFQTFTITGHTSTKVTALHDIQKAARYILRDVRMAYDTNLALESQVYDSLVLDWTDWTDVDPVAHHLEYTLSGGELQRNYDGNVTTIGRYLTSIEFSRQGKVITVNITSSPEGKPESAEHKTYLVSLLPLQDPVR